MNGLSFIDFVYFSWYYFKTTARSKFYAAALLVGLKLKKEVPCETGE